MIKIRGSPLNKKANTPCRNIGFTKDHELLNLIDEYVLPCVYRK